MADVASWPVAACSKAVSCHRCRTSMRSHLPSQSIKIASAAIRVTASSDIDSGDSRSYSSAAAPPMISLSSDVICVCRARLYCPRQVADHVVGVLGRGLHGDHAEDLFADGRVEKALEQPGLERRRHDLFQNLLRRRQKLVFDRAGRLLAAGGLVAGQFADRQQRLDARRPAATPTETSCRPRRAGRACPAM